MNWAYFCFGLALGGLIGFWIAWSLGRNVASNLVWERDQARTGMKACLKRLREAGVKIRRTDTLEDIEDLAGL